ncbi:prefoldin subunit 1-like [Eurytemora carolleeae]|uniref:prefoldin subunit 1-like n=1 Tax=Eurytemora carolleeae TaxID=1294199 RepID=UPI000C75C29E|nr:prefoldin subunit 1-like [Eurytemora carolleeae]|eukprot:XP_023338964.1 prefoldin subunit 1-like [Eurytemora affinis]
MSAPDLELKKAFGELQMKMVESKQKIKLNDMQVESLKRSIAHSMLTDQEIATLPQGTKVYESAGRMFLLSDIAEVRTGLENKQTVCKDKIKVLETSKEYLERSVKESENNLRELISQKKSSN